MRKNVRIISLTVFLISFLASCNNDFEDELDNTDSAITFRTTIVNESQTRVTGSSWDSGDAIGIYMKEADSNLSESSIVNGFKNIKYTTSGNGIFTSSAIPLYYPEDNRKVDFIAYYPYKNLNENTYPIDVSDQSSPQSIDFIYANNARGFNKTYNNPSFVFYRQLSKIRLNIKPRTGGISVEDITVKIVGMKTKASFDLAQGTTSVDETSGTDIPMKLSESSDGSILAEAVILPLVHTGNCRIVFTYSGKDYTWYVLSSTEFKKGYKYAYDIELKADGSIVIPKPSEGWFEKHHS